MSIQTYGYEAHFKWKWHKTCDPWAIPSKETVEAQLTSDFKTAFLAEFAETLTKEGHWYSLTDVTTTFTKYEGSWGIPLPVPPFYIDVEGETVISFQSDIKDASAHNSPQLWEEIKEAIWDIAHYIGLHPEIGVLLLTAGVLTILAIWLINTITGAILSLGSNIGASVLTLGILGIMALGIYALFLTKKGKKTRSKARRK
jgi:hypothetical protein